MLENDVWWHAVVCDRCTQQGLRVYFTGTGERNWVDSPAAIRHGKIYVAGQWHPRPLPANLPKNLVRPQGAAAAAPTSAQQPKARGRPATAPKSAKAAAAAGMLSPSVSNDENAEQLLVRRSARERESRITMVDGKPVLKLNMYDIEGGERSVFDQELNREWGRAQLWAGQAASSGKVGRMILEQELSREWCGQGRAGGWPRAGGLLGLPGWRADACHSGNAAAAWLHSIGWRLRGPTGQGGLAARSTAGRKPGWAGWLADRQVGTQTAVMQMFR